MHTLNVLNFARIKFCELVKYRFFAGIKFRESACINYFACTNFCEFLVFDISKTGFGAKGTEKNVTFETIEAVFINKNLIFRTDMIKFYSNITSLALKHSRTNMQNFAILGF